MKQELIIRPLPSTRIKSTMERVRDARVHFEVETGCQPTKLFISVELMEMLLAEVFPMAKEIKIEAPEKKKNQIDGLDVYHVVEPGVIEVGL